MKLYLLVSLFFCLNAFAVECESDLSVLPTLPPQIEKIHAQFLKNVSLGQDLRLQSEDIIVGDGQVTFKKPRINKIPLASFEFHCVEFGRSLFGKEICLKSEPRNGGHPLCRSLGFDTSKKAPDVTIAMTNNKTDRHTFIFSEGKWAQQDMTYMMPKDMQYEALESVTCYL